jgi:hypothetical protein
MSNSHPQCCKNPETCTLTYREHLIDFGLSATAIPSRAVNRTPGQPDEPAIQAHIRERRWERDIPAYRRLRADGLQPREVNGAALREKRGETRYDIESRPVKIDWNDPK